MGHLEANKWMVDSSSLKGVAYRWSKNLDDRDRTRRGADFREVLHGIDTGDGWLCVQVREEGDHAGNDDRSQSLPGQSLPRHQERETDFATKMRCYQHPSGLQISYENGSVYNGQTRNGTRHGHGLWKGRTVQYEGEWVDDQEHGEGRQTRVDGSIYEGQFKHGRFSGRGRMSWSTKQTYEGQYENDLRHGIGRFTWPDGRIYDGQWVKDRRHGQGKYTNSEGETRVYQFVDDKRDKELQSLSALIPLPY